MRNNLNTEKKEDDKMKFIESGLGKQADPQNEVGVIKFLESIASDLTFENVIT